MSYQQPESFNVTKAEVHQLKESLLSSEILPEKKVIWVDDNPVVVQEIKHESTTTSSYAGEQEREKAIAVYKFLRSIE